MDLYESLVELRREGKRGAMATIIRRLGSTPRKDHAKMLIREDGSTVGSVGGGCVEAEVWETARQVMESGKASIVRYEMKDEDAAEEGLVCGGTVEVFVEPVLPDPKVVLLGAGHVGQAIARAAAQVGFQMSVADDRENFANADRFPQAQEIVVADFQQCFSRITVNPNTFVLVVTRGHSHDQVALGAAIQTNARYVGLIGSRRKIKIIVEALLNQGLDPGLFDKLYAPIGLDIGSETPEEIAVSVVAELIAVRKGVHRRNPKQEFIRSVLEKRAALQV